MQKKTSLVCITLCLQLLFCSRTPDAPIPLPDGSTRGHAHNDYEQKRPLLDALEHGFTSIEADIHVLDGQLYVAHDKEDIDSSRTLTSLYLDPLRVFLQKNKGDWDKGTPCFLFIDIKSDADSTWLLLEPLLQRYKSMLCEFAGNGGKRRPVTVVVSGNRPVERMKELSRRYAALDGRMEDLDTNESRLLIPLVSGKWGDFFTWQGRGPMPAEEHARLLDLVRKAHQSGRRIRFWATDVAASEDQAALWSVLYQAGVDLINTDKLEALRSFLLEQGS
ncbi:MAG TPA: phosphatidylinositol-specific phospholipase C/glycerophosphodiester phosphodiesterase family protein [bacterium]|nr:phosphatidylinositol-specific phospholipase C/glycerophosphodiester phosphodiesterase family protein [bacterium]HPN36273.1 phosphatidylinositol-specific phospholipase C/glycerophosphodiester phosphodiesterase family protein [bacterium]